MILCFCRVHVSDNVAKYATNIAAIIPRHTSELCVLH